jgi:hypothetical protein
MQYLQFPLHFQNTLTSTNRELALLHDFELLVLVASKICLHNRKYREFKTLLHIRNLIAPFKFSNKGKKPFFQDLLFYWIGVCRKFLGGTGINDY